MELELEVGLVIQMIMLCNN